MSGKISLSPKSLENLKSLSIACTLITAKVGSKRFIIFKTRPNFLMFSACLATSSEGKMFVQNCSFPFPKEICIPTSVDLNPNFSNILYVL